MTSSKLNFIKKIKRKILNSSDLYFEELSLELFRWQAKEVSVYKAYLDALRITPEKIDRIAQIPFLPLIFFKTHKVSCYEQRPAAHIFESSGTGSTSRAKHYIYDADFAEKIAQKHFCAQYGRLEKYRILALLPSYLERKNASLVFMVQHLMKKAGNASGFFLHNFDELKATLAQTPAEGVQTLLLGVTFALLDFAQYHPDLSNCLLIETGGMKGRGKEKIRAEVHDILKKQCRIKRIDSEYGMTELTSQAYAIGNEIFRPPPWMRLLVRDVTDPFTRQSEGRGGINIIDLANIESCAFLETQDTGVVYPDHSFRILGRLDHTDLRGCNLMLSFA